jgi:hypothetical protein
MRRSTLFRAVIVAIAAALLNPTSASASTAAWLLSDAIMIAGPGQDYKVIGSGAKGALVAVEECRRDYCQIDFEGKIGWVALSQIGFGLEARGPWTGPHFNAKSGGGSACLYTAPNFGGDYLCRDSGFVVTDFARTGLDDLFVSVQITGEASVLVCRDLNFSSYCETITKDTPRLNRFLANNVSSIHIY